MTEPQEEIVVTRSGRLTGCRGRVLVALLVLAALVLLLLVMIVRGMLSGTPPQPVRRASLDQPVFASHARKFGDSTFNSLLPLLDAAAGRDPTVNGEAFGPHTGHHHAPLLLLARNVTVRQAPPANRRFQP